MNSTNNTKIELNCIAEENAPRIFDPADINVYNRFSNMIKSNNDIKESKNIRET